MLFNQNPIFYFEVASRLKQMFVAKTESVSHECRDLEPENGKRKNIYSEIERDLRTY